MATAVLIIGPDLSTWPIGRNSIMVPDRTASERRAAVQGTTSLALLEQDQSLVHLALYEFGSVEEAEDILDSAALPSQSAEFDRVWGTGITRTREVGGGRGTLHRPAT